MVDAEVCCVAADVVVCVVAAVVCCSSADSCAVVVTDVTEEVTASAVSISTGTESEIMLSSAQPDNMSVAAKANNAVLFINITP